MLQAKHTVLGWGVADGPLAHAMSSCMSGFVAATVSTPADVIKTRIMNQVVQFRLIGTCLLSLS